MDLWFGCGCNAKLTTYNSISIAKTERIMHFKLLKSISGPNLSVGYRLIVVCSRIKDLWSSNINKANWGNLMVFSLFNEVRILSFFNVIESRVYQWRSLPTYLFNFAYLSLLLLFLFCRPYTDSRFNVHILIQILICISCFRAIMILLLLLRMAPDRNKGNKFIKYALMRLPLFSANPAYFYLNKFYSAD